MGCLALLGAPGVAHAQTAGLPPDYGGFVTVEGTKFKLNGGDFYFSGGNTYAMIYSREQAEEIMRVGQSLGLNAIRMWGFWDGEAPTVDEDGNIIEGTESGSGTDRYGRPVLQSRPREYNELAFRKFDYAIYLAHLYGMKLIIPLMNEWDEFGGIKQYIEWTGQVLPEPQDGYYANENAMKALRYQFFESQECKDIYFDYVYQVLNRVNTITGVAYKDDPAIMIWEVMNEPRFSPWLGDPSATAVRDFIREAAEFIKSIDQNHLVGTGEEGFLNPEDAGKTGYPWDAASGEGSSFVLNSQIDAIDVMTFHAWPFNWAVGSAGYIGNVEDFVPEWIEEHARIAQEIGKPLYLGEFGWQILRRDGSDLAQRDLIMTRAYEAALANDLGGIAFWNLIESHDPSIAVYEGPIERARLDSANYMDGTVPHDQDFRFDIFCPEDESTCGIISGYTEDFTSRVQYPDPLLTSSCFLPRSLCEGQCVLTDSHPNHCGACGNVCSGGQACQQGQCVDQVLTPDWDSVNSPYDTTPTCTVRTTGAGGGSPRGRLGATLALILAGAWWRRSRREA